MIDLFCLSYYNFSYVRCFSICCVVLSRVGVECKIIMDIFWILIDINFMGIIVDSFVGEGIFRFYNFLFFGVFG